MKVKIIIGIIIVNFIGLAITAELFAMARREQPERAPVKGGPAMPKPKSRQERKINQMKAEMTEKAKETLTSKEWMVYLTYKEAKPKAAATTDVLTFVGSKVASENLMDKEFSKSNYALTVQDDGSAVWETMQVNPSGDKAFLRGELRGEAISGVIVLNPSKGAKLTIYFSSVTP